MIRLTLLLTLLLSGCADAPEWDCRNACYHKTGSSFTCGCD